MPGRSTCATATASWIGAPSVPYVRLWYSTKKSWSSATNVPAVPEARSRSTCDGIISALWVTSRPIIVTGTPLWKTRHAASGST